ncbi:CHAT domain-containing protein [Ferruginibacter sp.]|nr:CHAT domain-containing protein [Ferruginibacter sp.]
MFWNKNAFSVLIAILILTINSCINKTSSIAYSVTDTAAINSWKKNFDTLFKQYRNSNDIKFIKQASPYADSLLQIDKQILNDTNYRKIYLSVLFNYAAGLNVLENFLKSRGLFEQYIFLSGKYNLKTNIYLAYAQLNLGNIYSRYGDYKKASRLLQQSLQYYISINNIEGVSSSIINLSIPLKELQRYTEAEQTLQKILHIPTATTKRKAIAFIELADIFIRQHKVPEAGVKIQKAKQLLTGIPNDIGITKTYATLFSIEGDWQMACYNPKKALQAYLQSLDSAKIASAQNLRNREIGKTYIAIGNALQSLHFYDSAMQFYNRALFTVINIDTLNKFALPQQKDLYAENTIAEALYARADCIISRGMENTDELENAVSCYQLAFATESKLLNAFSYDESRLYMVEQTRQQTEKAIDICYRLLKKTNDNRWAAAAFLFAENNKSFVLKESVKRNIAASLFIQEDSTYKKIQELQSRLATVEIGLNQQQFSALPDAEIVKKLLADKQELEQELLQNENAVKIKNPQYSNWLGNETALTASEIINRVAGEGTTMVEYFAGDAAVYAFSAAKGGALSFHKLLPQVKALSDSFLFFFSSRNLILNKPAAYAVTANRLYDLLLAPLLPSVTPSLLIVPDGFISFIPFDALLTSLPKTAGMASFPFLIKQAEITNAFSCKTILAQQQIKNTTGNNSILAFAPGFINNERGFAPLLHSNEELMMIKEFYPAGKYFTNNTATLQQFKNNYSEAAIIHLATHANAGSDSVLAGIEFYDSTLYLNTVYTMPLKARLVVLSGCETGTGNMNKTEGLMSLARGFSYAGTKNVVAGLWQTEDKTSGELFKNFYGNLEGNSISRSLQKAKLQLLQNASVSQASPFYWAGYIYIGSPQEKINEKQGSGKIIIFTLGALLLLGIGFIFKRRKRSIG